MKTELEKQALAEITALQKHIDNIVKANDGDMYTPAAVEEFKKLDALVTAYMYKFEIQRWREHKSTK